MPIYEVTVLMSVRESIVVEAATEEDAAYKASCQASAQADEVLAVEEVVEMDDEHSLRRGVGADPQPRAGEEP
jgi:hypothetical protein